MSFVVVIPARFHSTRLPGKPLADIAGKPMVVRVAERARLSAAETVLIAADHAGVADAARSHGCEVRMTRADHPSGTDRLAEVVALEGWRDDQIVVNVQGDEPLIDPAVIDTVAHELERDESCAIATASHAIHDASDFFNPNVVKVVTDRRRRALYFSRAPIPFARDAFSVQHWGSGTDAAGLRLPEGLGAERHVGIYAYRAAFLTSYASLAASPHEQFEALEQLRALWHGHGIRVARLDRLPEAGVDTPADLERVRKKFDESRN